MFSCVSEFNLNTMNISSNNISWRYIFGIFWNLMFLLFNTNASSSNIRY